jgi:RHS repeat-associated protein
VLNPATGQLAQPTITHTWDWLDDETQRVDVRGKTWTYLYDALRRLTKTTSPSGLVTDTEYRLRTGTTYDHKVTTWTPPGATGGVPTVSTLDVLGRETQLKTGTLVATIYAYDGLDRRTQVTDPASVDTTFTYNAYGQTKTRVDFAGSGTPATTTFTYDPAGRLDIEDGPRTGVTDSLSYDYDLAGRLTSAKQDGITLPGGGTGVTTSYLWDDASERVRVSQPLTSSLTHVRNWTYDASGRMASFLENGTTTTYAYGAGNQLEQVGDPRGITLRFEYDNLGRRTRRYALAPGVTDDQTFSFDQSGNVLSANVVSSGTTIAADYDNDGRLWKVYQASYPAPTSTYTYDPSTGRLSSEVDPAGTTSYAYNANGLLSDMTDPFSATHVIYSYDTAGRVYQRTDGSGLCWTQTYEAETGRPDIRQIRQGGPSCLGATHATFDLGYDVASNVTSRAETITGNTYGGSYTYGYDGANRLTNVTGPAAFGSRTYGYDGGGNRTSVQVGTGNPVTTTYNAAGLPTTSSDNTSYTHDAIGELTKIDRTGGTANDWNFKYDSWGNLKSAARKTTGTPDVSFIVDALDRTISRTAGTTVAAYTYQGMGQTLAKSVVGATTTTYAHTPGGPLAQRIGATTRYYVRDQHGDTVGWANTSSGLAGTALYDPWGQILSGTGEMGTVAAEGSFRFQSDLTDALTGQVDMGARLYEPVLGRFSSRDPLFGEPLAPLSLNQFVYGGASPVTFSDPTGLVQAAGGGWNCDRACQEEAQQDIWQAGGSYECVTCSPAAEPPFAATHEHGRPPPRTEEVPKATFFTDVMNNEQLPLEERAAAAQGLIDAYGDEGAEIVEDWVAALRLAEEASIGYQLRASAFDIYKKVVQCASGAIAGFEVGALVFAPTVIGTGPGAVGGALTGCVVNTWILPPHPRTFEL